MSGRAHTPPAASPARKRLQAYTQAAVPEQDFPHDPLLKRVAKRFVPQALRTPVALAATSGIRARERRRARDLAGRTPLLLHLGSSRLPKAGWVNVDLLGHPVDLAWNVAHPLPLADGSADAIFHEHLLEHLSLEEALRLTDDCYRLLKPGGVLRIAVPDALAYARSYVNGGEGFLRTIRPGRPTPLLALAEVFYCCGHRTMYDEETLSLLLAASGFETIERREFGDSRLDAVPDSDHRRAESLYVEAVK